MFLVSFPGIPEEHGEGWRVLCAVPGQTAFCVNWHDLEGEEWSPDAAERLACGERVLRQHLVGPNGTSPTLAVKDLSIEGVPIRELQGMGTGFTVGSRVYGDHYLRCRMFVVGHRRFTLIGEVPRDRADMWPEIERFFGSFRILKRP